MEFYSASRNYEAYDEALPNVLVRGRKKAYPTLIHAKLLPLIHYAAKGDIGFVKFRRGEAFIVGFRKNNRGDLNV